MPSDPDQDYDEGQSLMAEDARYWRKVSDPMTEYCDTCGGFYGECDCEEDD